MAIYAIGDIQGCYQQLRGLLDLVKFDPSSDRLWSVGDLVNRGPDSLETLRFFKSLGQQATITLGNHDLHFLALAFGAKSIRKKDTLGPLLAAPDRDEIVHWLRRQPILHYEIVETDQGQTAYLMSHAGLPHVWTVAQAQRHAKQVETVLAGPDIEQFLQHMYGDQPNAWHDNLTGYDRLRVITNYLTRMRFIDEAGRLDLSIKTALLDKPQGYQAWFEYYRGVGKISDSPDPGLNIIFGHWAALEGKLDVSNIHALDTGCVWKNRLTLMRLSDRKLFSCACG